MIAFMQRALVRLILLTAMVAQPLYAQPATTLMLDHDVAHFRSHLERLAANYPSVSDRVQRFKSEARAAKFEPPRDYKVQPSYGYIRAEVLKKNEGYYTVSGYTIAKEQGKMRIVEIRFFNRLF